MDSYYNRYVAGQHEAVWRELQSLGAAVRDEPIYSDAVAVAHETMRRVRANVLTLIERLPSLGYRFGKRGLWEGSRWEGERLVSDEEIRPLTPPYPDTDERIASLEAEHGLLPISLRAFYEIVGAVNLCGYFYWGEDAAKQNLAAIAPDGGVPETLDPLQILPLDSKNVSRRTNANGFATLYVVDDPLAKMGFSAVGSLETSLPSPAMDVHIWLEEPIFEEHWLLTNTLRRAFQYGGFNHLCTEAENDLIGTRTAAFLRAMRTTDNESYLDFLARDLMSI